MTQMDGGARGGLVPPPRAPQSSEVMESSEGIDVAEVIDLAAADQRLAERHRRREQLLHELETARAARRRRRGGLRQA